MQSLKWLVIYLIVCFPLIHYSQTKESILDTKISIQVKETSLVDVFSLLSKQHGLSFSYSPSNFDDKRKVTLTYSDIKVRQLLDIIFKGTSHYYKVKKNYIIIAHHAPLNSGVYIRGYIYDKNSSSGIDNVSIYVKDAKYACLSDNSGYFILKYDRGNQASEKVKISIAKENYKDTSIFLQRNSDENYKVYLSKEIPDIKPKKATELKVDTQSLSNLAPLPVYDRPINSDKTFISSWLRSNQIKQSLRNINDTLFSALALTLVPPIGTNRLLSINTVNKTAFNILIGHSKGIKYAEFGGLMNIDNGNVRYVQAAGFANIVSDSLVGVQAAGFFNIVNKNVSGVQASGFFGRVRSLDGIQASGFLNSAKRVKGVQAAGFLNLADSLKGLQAAGFYSRAKRVDGVQVSGFLNTSKFVKGSQISVINISDSINGIPIGIFSYVKHGYHDFELAYDEIGFLRLGYRTGVELFHNVFTLGSNFSSGKHFLNAGYGLGSLVKVSKRWYLNADVSSQIFLSSKFDSDIVSGLYKLFIGTEYKLNQNIGLAFGPSLNFFNHYAENGVKRLDEFKSILPPSFYNETNSLGTYKRLWLGFNVGLRLF
jgi:hypothetical protein